MAVFGIVLLLPLRGSRSTIPKTGFEVSEPQDDMYRKLLHRSLSGRVEVWLRKFERLKNVLLQMEALTNVVETRISALSKENALLRQEQRDLKRIVTTQSQTLRWMVEQSLSEPSGSETPSPDVKVSVIVPTRNRAGVIEQALQSVLSQTYGNWECVIIDDGSEDDTPLRVEKYLADSRVHYVRGPHRNVSAARNAGLARAKGQVIAYLDTDNFWHPNYLKHVVEAFEGDPNLDAVYAAQIVDESDPRFSYVRSEEFDLARLRRENYIDLNVFAHRRRMSEQHGGFDERMDRLNDWDLILRFAERGRVLRIPAIGGVYRFGRTDQITRTRNCFYNLYLLRQKQQKPQQGDGKRPLKILYALWHYPQLSESYVRAEIRAALKLGVEIEVWSEENVAAPYESEVPYHRGRLTDVIDRFKPDVLHTHWLHVTDRLLEESEDPDLPITVRAHGFEFTPERAANLDRNPRVKGIYLFPNQASKSSTLSDKVIPLPAVFEPDFYYPGAEKDRRLVLRVSAALPTKDLACFMETARLCPDHRFILVLCRAYLKESVADEISGINREMGSPVEISINLQHEEVAQMMRNAGIYMHTANPAEPFGMPISICEAMASGCYVLARRMSDCADYLGDAGSLYDTPEEAARMIRNTTGWTGADWDRAGVLAIDRAYSSFVNTDVVPQIVDHWRMLAEKSKRSIGSQVLSPGAVAKSRAG
jgi:glycosyltransferase involved in cell wall biosynthesis